MITIVEMTPLPERCLNCGTLEEMEGNIDAACYNCDYALDRFIVEKENAREE